MLGKDLKKLRYICMFCFHRYIEIFKSSMSEANAAGGGMRGGIHPLMALGLSRPGPYDRGDRFGMGMGMMGYGGRGRNLKGM